MDLCPRSPCASIGPSQAPAEGLGGGHMLRGPCLLVLGLGSSVALGLGMVKSALGCCPRHR